MFAGIGALIVIGQFHILFDGRPFSSGLANLAAMPGRILGLDPLNMQAAELALLLGLVTIGTMLAWEKMRLASLKLVPGALLGVLAATLLASGFGLNVARVDVPASISGAIDTPAGGVLVVTGWRLVSVTHVRHLFQNYGMLTATIWALTFLLVVLTDLLTGVLVGLALSLLELIPHRRSLRLKVNEEHGEERSHLRPEGAATFVSLTRLTEMLERIPLSRPVHLDLHRVKHTTAEMVREWLARRRSAGGEVRLAGEKPMVDRLYAAH